MVYEAICPGSTPGGETMPSSWRHQALAFEASFVAVQLRTKAQRGIAGTGRPQGVLSEFRGKSRRRNGFIRRIIAVRLRMPRLTAPPDKPLFAISISDYQLDSNITNGFNFLTRDHSRFVQWQDARF